MRVPAAAIVGVLVGLDAPMAQQPLELVHRIELPGVEGRIDHLAVDRAGQRLFVAALGNNTVEILDLKGAAHLRSLSGFREPQGIAAVPDRGLIAVANGEGEGVQLLSANDFRPAQVVRLGDDSDNVRYDASAKRIYVGFGSGALAAIGSADAKVIGEVKLPGHPESFQLEEAGSRTFVNVPTANQIAVIDRSQMKILATWPVRTAKSNFPMALDETGHRLFVGCRQPAKMLVYDTMAGKEVGSFDIVGDTDDVFYDAARKRVYVTGGEGYLDVFQAEAGTNYPRLARIPTAAGARTSLFIPELNRLYVAVPHRGTQKAQVYEYEVR